MRWALALAAGAGHGQTRGKCGHIERKGGGDMTILPEIGGNFFDFLGVFNSI